MSACENCPNRIENTEKSHIFAYHADGTTTYITGRREGCGPEIIHPEGPLIDRLTDAVDACERPAKIPVLPDGFVARVLHRTGIRRQYRYDCEPTLRFFDDSSPNQIREFFDEQAAATPAGFGSKA